eukprot:NODE_218_length_14160_cov_0.274874.p1 type:complete len:741 gc:universal NODE_218_length_14160_cov_0.274874:12495-10273(-)
MTIPPSPAFKKQTVIVEPGNDTYSGVYRANTENMYGSNLKSKLHKVHPDFPNVDTIHTAFQSGYNFGPTNRCLGYRPLINNQLGKKYEWITYEDVEVLRNALGSGLINIQNRYCSQSVPKDIPFISINNIGIISINRREWTIFDLACAAYSKINVPIYDTFGQEAIEYIINHANLQIVVASADKMPLVLACAAKCPCLKVVVCIDSLNDTIKDFLSLNNEHLHIFKNGSAGTPPVSSTKQSQYVESPTNPITNAKFKDYLLLLQSWAANSKIQFFTYFDVLLLGRLNPINHMPPSPSTVSTISYTSGTTGLPKGVVLNHQTFACEVVFPVFAHLKWIPEDDCLISYLPLAHIFGRVSELTVLTCGARIGYFSGDTLKLLEDIQVLQPTFFPSVPRLLNRVYIQVQQATVSKHGVVGWLFNKAFATKLDQMARYNTNWHSVIDNSPLFMKLRKILGGRVRVIITGSAPIDDSVLLFLRACFGCVFVQGYGQTESCAGSVVSISDDFESGHTGVPIACNEIKLKSTGHYSVKDIPFPRGEILIRGYNVFDGYWRDVAKTKETLIDGWLHTGDVGEIDKYGRLKIIDRIKNIFKLSQGEYVAVEKIEGVYATNKYVGQIYVHGDSLESCLVAIVVPNPLTFGELIKSCTGKDVGLVDNLHPELNAEYCNMCKDSVIVEYMVRELESAAKGKLKGFEMVKKIVLIPQLMTIENGMVTPSFKTRRNEVKEYYKKVLKDMYLSLKK